MAGVAARRPPTNAAVRSKSFIEFPSQGSFTQLVVLLRHLHPPDTGLGANVGVKRTTSKLLVLVELLNLTFDLELDVRRNSNVKFAPLGCADCLQTRTSAVLRVLWALNFEQKRLSILWANCPIWYDGRLLPIVNASRHAPEHGDAMAGVGLTP
ncbi:hypothetical protein CHELA40_10706 [Chelatococcus asaccharovorans]|nr:hypothetical protein CHELA40_10706 [Chelatococcus asaccharovorans]CAH1686225.1 hypothetical protein CHELA17_64901 [Chelatococcus asaccharovorans]